MDRSHPEMAQTRANPTELLVDSDKPRRAPRRHSGAQNLSILGVVTGFFAVTTGALITGMGETPNGPLSGAVAGGLAPSLHGNNALLTAALTGGWRPSTLSHPPGRTRPGRAEPSTRTPQPTPRHGKKHCAVPRPQPPAPQNP